MKFATPLITDVDGGVERLVRLSLQNKSEGGYNEAWLQGLVDNHPSVLPIDQIEIAFTPAVSVCTELPLASGFLDNLLVTPLGNLIAVECKLWRNPEARREVVAQIIDYAKDLQRLSFDEFEKALGLARKQVGFNLHAHVSGFIADTEPSLDEPRFVDAVSKNLSRGRCLLLVVGDGVTEGVEAMSAFLQQHAGLHFGLAVVQLAVYETPGSQRRLVVTSVPLTTTNIVRGIVEVSDGKAVVLPPPPSLASGKGATLTEDQFMSGLDMIRPGTSARLRNFLDAMEDIRVEYEVLKTLVVRMIVGELRMIAFVVNPDGVVDTGYVFKQKELFRPFEEQLAAAIPFAVLKETPASWYVTRKKSNGTPLTIWDFLDHANAVRSALETLNQSMMKVASAEAAS